MLFALLCFSSLPVSLLIPALRGLSQSIDFSFICVHSSEYEILESGDLLRKYTRTFFFFFVHQPNQPTQPQCPLLQCLISHRRSLTAKYLKGQVHSTTRNMLRAFVNLAPRFITTVTPRAAMHSTPPSYLNHFTVSSPLFAMRKLAPVPHVHAPALVPFAPVRLMNRNARRPKKVKLNF